MNRVSYGNDYNQHDGNSFEYFNNGTSLEVCTGYTCLFLKFCRITGIKAQYLSSNALNHAWNRVMIDGVWYDIDVTWDDLSLYGDYNIYYTYFLIPAGTGVFADRQDAQLVISVN